MPHRDFRNLDKLPIVFVIATSLLSGVLQFLQRKQKYTFGQALVRFFMDTATTLIIGISAYLAMVGYDLNNVLAAGVSSLIAHNGTRAIFLTELVIADKLGSQSAKEAIKEEMERKNV